MKPLLAVITVLVLVFASATLLPAHTVEDHETITQLLWNDKEAFVVSGIRRDGWSGSYAGLALEMVRALFGAIPRYEANSQWVVVAHITPDGVRLHTEKGLPFFHPQPFDGALFRDGDPILRWEGDRFVPVSDSVRAQFQARSRSSMPSYSNVGGWSSKMNLLNDEQPQSETALTLAGTQVTVLAVRADDRANKTVTVRLGGAKTEDVVSINERPRLVTGTEYAKLMKSP